MYENARDVILHGRYQLEDAGLDSDQTNAVLGVLDDAFASLATQKKRT